HRRDLCQPPGEHSGGRLAQGVVSGGTRQPAPRVAEGPAAPRRGLRTHGLPFAVHQLCEYGLGFFLVAGAPQLTPHGFEVVAGAGVALIVWAAMADGFLGLRWVSRPLHGTLDWAVLLALVCSPFLLQLGSELAAI